MKIKKRQWAIFGLALVICFALYLNWRFSDDTTAAKTDSPKVLGEAQFVSTETKDATQYFTQSRLTRQKSKEDALDLLESVIASSDSSETVKQQANNEKMAIAANNENETTIENLVKAKGFSDCVTFINDDNVNVVVQSTGLQDNQVAQIQEIVVSQTKVKPSQVKIVEVKN